MKKIEAIIEPFELDEVKASLGGTDAAGLTVAEVRDCGLQNGRHDRYWSASGSTDSAPRFKLEIIIDDHHAGQVASAIERASRTGRGGGQGTITILTVDDAVRIRTGERGAAAV
jgi:nitrogen regulatory protein P-II 1